MIEIHGKAATAICFAETLDSGARQDIRALCDHELMRGRNIRIMPDVHYNGDGSVTGFTMTLREPVILALEYGSGCGVLCAKLQEREIDPALLDGACHEIPTGRNHYLEPAFDFDFSVLRCYGALRKVYAWPAALGSLGGGNHFIELGRDEEGALYLIIHNGLGAYSASAVAHYLKKARERSGNPSHLTLEDTCLYGQDMEDYLHDMKVFEDLCRLNRRFMLDHILGRLELTTAEVFDICHHYTDAEDGIVRHGAISAHAGEKVIIPVSGGAGCILGTGLGNPDWNSSAPHGAGRRLSRSEARRTISIEDYRAAMWNVYSTTVCEDNLDEAPAAYKTLKEIADSVRPSVRIDRILQPVYNYKG